MRDSEEIIELLGVWQDHLEDCRRDESWSINVDDDLSDVPILKIFVQMGEGLRFAHPLRRASTAPGDLMKT